MGSFSPCRGQGSLANLVVLSRTAKECFHLSPWSFTSVLTNCWAKILPVFSLLPCFSRVFCFPQLHVPWTPLSHTSLSLCPRLAKPASFWVSLCLPTLCYFPWELSSSSSNLMLIEHQVHLITGSKIANILLDLSTLNDTVIAHYSTI